MIHAERRDSQRASRARDEVYAVYEGTIGKTDHALSRVQRVAAAAPDPDTHQIEAALEELADRLNKASAANLASVEELVDDVLIIRDGSPSAPLGVRLAL
jgi:hypothetical protein